MNISLDQESPVPLYHQLAKELESKIENEVYAVGEHLPTEKEMEKELSVSRTTIRKAFDVLIQKGLIERKRGIGSIIKNPKVKEHLPKLRGFTEEMTSRGHSVHSEVLEVDKLESKIDVKQSLGLSEDVQVIKVERIRYIEEKKLALQTSYLPDFLDIGLDEDFSGSLYEIIESKHGVKIGKGETSIYSSAASEREADLLEIDPGEPVLKYDRLTFDKLGREIEFVKGVYRSDRYKFKVSLRR